MSTMLTCYLDDSGKRPDSSVITIAGYIADDMAWAAFETEVEPIFVEYGVTILHATDLHGTKGEFAGWPRLKKQAFIAKICQIRNRHVMMGFSMSAVKEVYKTRAGESDRKRTVAPYTFCFNVVLDWILRDISIGRKVHGEGVQFALEAGHENNVEARQRLDEIREKFGLVEVLRSMTFVPKTACRAIQLADLLAFYSRRDAAEQVKAHVAGLAQYKVEFHSRIIIEGLAHRGFVALDFDNPDDTSPYFDFGAR